MKREKIFENNKQWVKKKMENNPQYFTNLAKKQNPKILYIGCSDSRVSVETMMGAEPGEIFVHRNIANMVISADLNAMSIIEYAVQYLKVEQIIICGHYNCGGVKAAMQSEDLGILNPWLRNIRDVYRIHYDELEKISSDEKKYDRLVELNVQEQCINVLKTACVQKAIHKKEVTVEGFIFNVHTGFLKNLHLDFPALLKNIEKIYRLTE